MESWRNYLNEEEELQKKVIFMAGAPGAGKSTVIDKLGLQDMEIINPDEFYEPALEKCGLGKNIKKIKEDYTAARASLKEALKEILAEEEPQNGWSHETLLDMYEDAMKEIGESRWELDLKVAKKQYDEKRERVVVQVQCFNQAQKDAKTKQAKITQGEKSFIIDGTGGRFAVIRNQKDNLEATGYNTAMIFVDLPLQTAIDRQERRGEEGGRTLDSRAIERSWLSVDKNRDPYQELFGDTFFHITATDEEMDENIAEVKPKVDAFLSQMNEDFQSELKPRLHKQMRVLLHQGGNQTSGPFNKKAPIDYRGSKPPGAPGG